MHSIIHLLLPFLATSTLVHCAAIEVMRTVDPAAYTDEIESRELPYVETPADIEARALLNASCPDWNKIEPPEKNLGPVLTGKCSWKETLICASLLVGCPAGCIAAAIEVGLNPFATTECIACLGVTGGNCAFCIWGPGLVSTCNAIFWEPQAQCLLPMCNQKLIAEAKAHPPPAAMAMANRLLPGLPLGRGPVRGSPITA